MNTKRILTCGFWVFLSEAMGALSAWLIRDGVRIYEETVIQPPFSPPSFIFSIVWPILFALMGIGVGMVFLSKPSPTRTKTIVLFFLQMALNFFWTLLFFNARLYGWSFLLLLLLWLVILWMVILFMQTRKIAGWMQLPYLLWVAYAAYLSLAVWLLNR